MRSTPSALALVAASAMTLALASPVIAMSTSTTGESAVSADAADRAPCRPMLRRVARTPLPGDYASGDLAISGNGAFAVVTGDDGVQKVRIVPGRQQVLGGNANLGGRAVTLHRNARVAYLVRRDNAALHVLDVTGDRPRLVRTLPWRTLAPDLLIDVTLSPNGRHAYLEYLGGARVLSLARPLRPRPVGAARTAIEGFDLTVTPNGRHLLSLVSSGSTDQLRRYSLRDPVRPRRAGVRGLGFSPSDVVVAPGGATAYVTGTPLIHNPARVVRVRLRDLRVQQSVGSGVDYSDATPGLALSPNGSRLVVTQTYSADRHAFQSFAAPGLRPLCRYSPFGWARATAFSPGGRSTGRLYALGEAGGARALVALRLAP